MENWPGILIVDTLLRLIFDAQQDLFECEQENEKKA